MKLLDLRKLAIKKQQRIHFQLKNGMQCVLDERGVALVPGLDRVPDFNLEGELESAAAFVLETPAKGPKNPAVSKNLSRQELEALLSAAPAAAAHHDEHDDE